MKKLATTLTGVCMVAAAMVAHAQDGRLRVENSVLGSGVYSVGNSLAVEVHHGVFHVPQYMPGFPTAATLWPTVIKHNCYIPNKDCDLFDYKPSYGRAEYLFFRPYEEKEPPAPVVNCCEKDRNPIVIYKEVPVKAKKQ